MYLLLDLTGKKPNIPLPSIVPKAETLEHDQQDDVDDLFSPSSPREVTCNLLEHENERVEDSGADDEDASADFPDSGVTEEQEGTQLFNGVSFHRSELHHIIQQS